MLSSALFRLNYGSLCEKNETKLTKTSTTFHNMVSETSSKEEIVSFTEARKRVFAALKQRQETKDPEAIPLPKIPIPMREVYNGETNDVQYCMGPGSSRVYGGAEIVSSNKASTAGGSSFDGTAVLSIPRLDTPTLAPDEEGGQVIGRAEWRVILQLVSVRRPEVTSLCKGLERLDSFRPTKKVNWLHHGLVVSELFKLGGPFLIQIFTTDYHDLIKRVGPTTIVRSGEKVNFAEGIPAELFYSQVKMVSPDEIHVLADKCESSRGSIPIDKSVGLWRGTVSHFEMRRGFLADLTKRLSF